MKLQMSREVDLGKEPVGKLLVILALPAITSSMPYIIWSTACTSATLKESVQMP